MMAASCIFAAGSMPGFNLLLWKVRIMFKDWLQKLMSNGIGKVSSTVQNELHNEINHEAFPNAVELYNKERMTGRGKGKYA